jgi:sodium/potassium-transporting ATPase subunit alpha
MPIENIENEDVSAVVVHGDDIDNLKGWQWDESEHYSRPWPHMP